jgi:hypothetical protein
MMISGIMYVAGATELARRPVVGALVRLWARDALRRHRAITKFFPGWGNVVWAGAGSGTYAISAATVFLSMAFH